MFVINSRLLSFLILIYLSLFLSVCNLYAEDTALSLKEIDLLITNTEYTKALENLTLYLKQNPDDFDNAQKRIKKIIKARLDFNLKAKKLVSMMDDTSDDEDALLSMDDDKMQIITMLESSEVDMSDVESAFTNDARRSIRLVYYKNKINQIIASGNMLYSQKQFYKGLEKLEEGLTLKKSNSDVIFDGPEEKVIMYSPDLTASVDLCINNIKKSCRSFELLFNNCVTYSNAVVKDVKDKSFKSFDTDVKNLEDCFYAFADVRNEIKKCHDELSLLDKSVLAQFPALNETSYITFACAGAKSIAASLDLFYCDNLNMVVQSLTDAIKKEYEVFASHINCDDILTYTDEGKISASLKNAITYCDIGVKVQSLYNRIDVQSADFDSIKTLCLDSEKTFSLLVMINKEVESKSYDEEGLIKDISFYQSHYEFFSNAKLGYSSLSYIPIVIKAESDFYYNVVDAICKKSFELTQQSWLTLCSFYDEYAVSSYDKYKELYGKNLFASGCGTGYLGSEHFRPDISFDNSKQNISEITAVCNTLIGYDKRLVYGTEYCSDIDEYDGHKKNIIVVIKELESLKDLYTSLTVDCQKRINIARLNLNSARDAVERSRQQLKKESYDSARSLLNSADEYYSESLAVLYDEAIVKERETLVSIAIDINNKQSKVIIVQAQELRKNAWTAYYDGNFALAKKYLEQAKSQWEKVSTTEDEETAYILSVVTAALSTTIGRYYEGKDTMFSEFSQVLNLSLQYYNTGLEQMNSGNREDALKTLSLAKEKLRGLLQSYPINHDVNHLLLLIEQLEDKNAFDKTFAKKVADAKKNYSSSNAKTKQRIYASLSDLSEIYPDYPGLKEQLLEVEYDLGLKMRPVKKSESNNAIKLYNEADKIYAKAGGNEQELNKAIAKLNEALKIDPRNGKISDLKLKIQSQMGSRASDILSAEDNEEYLRAIQIYSEGNTLVAQSMVQSLMAKGNNKTNKKLVALKKRIEASL